MTSYIDSVSYFSNLKPNKARYFIKTKL